MSAAPIDTPTLTVPILPLARSLEGNHIRAEAATALAAILNKTKITNLKCAATPEEFAFLSAPALADTFPARVRKGTHSFICPFPSTFPPLVPFRTHYFLGPFPNTLCFLVPLLSKHMPSLRWSVELSALARKRTRPFPPFPHPHDAALHRAPRGPRPRSPARRVGRACSRAHLTPLRPPRHSLQRNGGLTDEAKQAVKDAAGSGVEVEF
eukprot:scaffold37942_cov57-Phaeocystis_antarctica.AAC.3